MAEKDLKPFPKGVSGNPKGRPKGSRNRSTIIRELLMLDNNEEAIHNAQIEKAKEGDTGAYKAVLDSAYGMPTQQIDQKNTNIETEITPISFVNTENDKTK